MLVGVRKRVTYDPNEKPNNPRDTGTEIPNEEVPDLHTPGETTTPTDFPQGETEQSPQPGGGDTGGDGGGTTPPHA